MKRILLIVMSLVFSACRSHELPRRLAEHPPATPETPPEPPPAEVPVHVEEIAMAGDRAAYAVRGSKEHRHKAVFLAGLCSNPLWYLNTFAWAAVHYGDFVGVQGDIFCGGLSTRWSSDLALTERRIEEAAERAGLGELEDATLIGYSQGAERAEWLAAKGRFSRFILIGGPILPAASHFAKARAIVLMAGTRDRQDLMRGGAVALRKAGIPATFMVLPEARHGEMGPMAQDVLAQAFDWLDQNDKSTGLPHLAVTLHASRAIPLK